MQYKSFRGWCNNYLPPHRQIKALSTAFQDGLLLAKLLKDLSGESVTGLNKNAKMKIHRINNLFHCFNVMRDQKMKLQNISAEDVEECDLKLIVALIWHFIMHYELQLEDGGTAKDRLLERLNNFLQDQDDHSSASLITPSSPRQQPPEQQQQQQQPTATAQAAVVSNFDTAFQDGSVFFHMVKKHRPDLLPSEPASMTMRELLEKVFGLLNSVWGVPQLISVSEVVDSKPDDKSIMTYVALCLDAFSRTASVLTPLEAAEKLFKKALAFRPHGSPVGGDEKDGPGHEPEPEADEERQVELLFALDLSMSCMRAFGQECDKREELQKGLRRLKDLRSRFYAAASSATTGQQLGEVMAELERVHGELVQLITSDPEHQRMMKLRVKRWRRRSKDPKEDLHIQAWGSHLTRKLATLPAAPPGDDPAADSAATQACSKHTEWSIRRSIKSLEEVMAQCQGHLRVGDFDEGWFKVVVEVLVRNIRHALPYLLRRLLADTKTNNIDNLSVFSGEIQVEELDTDHNPFADLIRPLVAASIDLLLAFVSFRKQTNKVMMATMAAKRAHVRRASFSLHALLHKYLLAPHHHPAPPVIASPAPDRVMHRIRRIERLRRLVTAIKRRMQERFWRRPVASNELFDEGELFDLRWIQLISPLWLALLGKELVEITHMTIHETSAPHTWEHLRGCLEAFLKSLADMVGLLTRQRFACRAAAAAAAQVEQHSGAVEEEKEGQEEEPQSLERPRKWTAREDDDFMLQFRQLRRTLFRHLEDYIHGSRLVWNDDALPCDPPRAFPPALHDLHALAAQLMAVARSRCSSSSSSSGEEKEGSTCPSSSSWCGVEGEALEATERWVEACPVGSLVASNKSIVMQREWLVGVETSQRRRPPKGSSDSDSEGGESGRATEAAGIKPTEERRGVQQQQQGSGSRVGQGSGLLNSRNQKEIKVALHMNAAADAEVERQRRKEERRKEQEQRARTNEETFERTREELDNSRREWQLLRQDREKQKRDAARQRERDKIDLALAAAHQLLDKARLCASADPQLLLQQQQQQEQDLVGWFRVTVDALVGHVRKIAEGGPVRELTLLGFNNAAEFLLEWHLWRAAQAGLREGGQQQQHQQQPDHDPKGKGKARAKGKGKAHTAAVADESGADSPPTMDGSAGGRNAAYVGYLADNTRDGFVTVHKALTVLRDHQTAAAAAEGTSAAAASGTSIAEERLRTTKKRVRAMQEQVVYLVETLKEKLAKPFYLNGGGWRTEVDWLVMIVREILRAALESCPDVESGSAERVVEAHVAGMGLAVREMVGLMEQHFGTEVKVKKRFQDHRDDLLRHADDLVAALARLWSSRSSSSMNQPASHHQVAVATTTTTTTSTSASLPVERLLADLDDLELKKSRKRVPVVEAETTQQWAATLLAQMTALTPATADPASSAGHDEAEVGGVEAEGEEEAPDGDDEIDLEQEQAEAAQFMANAEEGVRQLNEVSALTDPDVMDVDDFDEDKFKTRVKVFFDTNKKTLLYLRKKSKQTFMRLALQARKLVDDSRGLLETVDEYKNTLTEKAKAKVTAKARGVKENVQGMAKAVTTAVKEEGERLQELKTRMLAAVSSEESEEEVEPGALHDIMEHLSSLHLKVERATSPLTSPRSPTTTLASGKAGVGEGEGEGGGEGPPALLTTRARMVNEKRRSWHSRQLEMRSIDAFLKQSKQDKDEDARLRRQRADQARRETDKRERKLGRKDSQRRKKQMRKLGRCVRECHHGLVKHLISAREATLVAHGQWTFDLRWFLFVTRGVLVSGKHLIALSEDRQGGDAAIARARALRASLLKLDDLLRLPPASSASAASASTPASPRGCGDDDGDGEEDLSLALRNFGLFRTNIIDDLSALIAALKLLWKRPTAQLEEERAAVASTVQAMEGVIRGFEAMERNVDLARRTEDSDAPDECDAQQPAEASNGGSGKKKRSISLRRLRSQPEVSTTAGLLDDRKRHKAAHKSASPRERMSSSTSAIATTTLRGRGDQQQQQASESEADAADRSLKTSLSSAASSLSPSPRSGSAPSSPREIEHLGRGRPPPRAPRAVTRASRKQEKRLQKPLAFIFEADMAPDAAPASIETEGHHHHHHHNVDAAEAPADPDHPVAAAADEDSDEEVLTPRAAQDKARRKAERRARREARTQRREWKQWKRDQNVGRMCDTLRSFANDLRAQIQARLWEPHVVAGEWTLDLDWFVAAAKEMVRVAEETIEQVGKDRTLGKEKACSSSNTRPTEGSDESDSSTSTSDAPNKDDADHQKSKSTRKSKAATKKQVKSGAEPRSADDEDDDKRRAAIVAGSHGLYGAMSSIVAMMLAHTPTDDEARRYGAYRKKVIDALNTLVVRMKAVWDVHPIVT